MPNPSRSNKNKKNKMADNNPSSGSAYNREHAGHVEGYGENYPISNRSSKTENPE